MRRLHLDCPSGVAGDMLLASLIDLGAPLDEVRKGLQALGLTEAWSISVKRVLKQGISALQLDVRIDGAIPDPHTADSQDQGASPRPDHTRKHSRDHDHVHEYSHGHDHDSHHGHAHSEEHGGHTHRPYRVIRSMLEAASLPERAKARALRVFAELARAEGAVHGVDPDEVHFHEVGSADAIIDIVGSCLALEFLEIDSLTASPLHIGRGFVRTAHGRMPIPAPATMRMLEGLDAYQTDITGELVTPTGAALIRALCERIGPMQGMRVAKVGCGAGRMNLPIPNVLRAIQGEVSGAARAGGDAPKDEGLLTDEVVELETNIDDLSPEIIPAVFERLFDAGAKDAWVVPATMKKGRPGYVLHVLGSPGDQRVLAEIIFQETTTLGMRIKPCRRWTLERKWFTIETKGGPVRVKVGLVGDTAVTVAPEFEDCRKAAGVSGLPVRTVMDIPRETARKGLNTTDE